MFATVEDVKRETKFKEVSALSSDKVERLISRAERWARLNTGRVFSVNTDDATTLGDLNRAIILLVDFLWWNDQPDVYLEQIDSITSEDIGSYSYTRNTDPTSGEGTGNQELDMILNSLKQPLRGVFYFGVSGPRG
jgi:hypothetical protein